MKLLIVLTIIVAIVISFYIALYINNKNQRIRIIEKLSKIGEVKEVKADAFDVILTVNNKKVFVKFLLLGHHKDLSINSFRHWQVDRSSKKIKLLKTGGFERLKQSKILLVSPALDNIVKYINENEVVFVKYDELCFDFYLFKVNEIDKIEEVIK